MRFRVLHILIIILLVAASFACAKEKDLYGKQLGLQFILGSPSHSEADIYIGLGMFFQLSRKFDFSINYRAITKWDTDDGCQTMIGNAGTYEDCDEPGYIDPEIIDNILEIDIKYFFLEFGDFRSFIQGGTHTNFGTVDIFTGGGIEWEIIESFHLFMEYGIAFRPASENVQYVGAGIKLPVWPLAL